MIKSKTERINIQDTPRGLKSYGVIYVRSAYVLVRILLQDALSETIVRV